MVAQARGCKRYFGPCACCKDRPPTRTNYLFQSYAIYSGAMGGNAASLSSEADDLAWQSYALRPG